MTVQPSVVFSPDSLNAGMTMMSSPKIVQPELTIHMHQQPHQHSLGHWHPVAHFSVDLLWLSLLSQPKASLSITFPYFVILIMITLLFLGPLVEGVYSVFWKWLPTFSDPVAPIFIILDFYLSQIYIWKYLMKIDSPLSSELLGNFKFGLRRGEYFNTPFRLRFKWRRTVYLHKHTSYQKDEYWTISL